MDGVVNIGVLLLFFHREVTDQYTNNTYVKSEISYIYLIELRTGSYSCIELTFTWKFNVVYSEAKFN